MWSASTHNILPHAVYICEGVIGQPVLIVFLIHDSVCGKFFLRVTASSNLNVFIVTRECITFSKEDVSVT
jgi:hypothetical protein